MSHCSHGGNSFTAETFVNDDRESGRRLRLWPERPSLTKVSAVKHAPPCETMDHTRPFQLSLVSRRRGPRLFPENRPGRMLLKLLSPIPHLLPYWRPDQRNCEPAQFASGSEAIQTKAFRSLVWIASSLRSLAIVQGHNFVDRASNRKEVQDRRQKLQQHSSGPVLRKKARAAPARDQHQLKRSSVIHRFAWRSVFHR